MATTTNQEIVQDIAAQLAAEPTKVTLPEIATKAREMKATAIQFLLYETRQSHHRGESHDYPHVVNIIEIEPGSLSEHFVLKNLGKPSAEQWVEVALIGDDEFSKNTSLGFNARVEFVLAERKQRFTAAIDALFESQLCDHPASTDGDFADALLELQPRERDLFVIGLLYGQVCNGGFLQWHDNGYSHTAGLVEHALRSLGGPEADEVLSLIGEVMPLIEDAGHAEAEGDEGHYEEICDQLDALDSRFYEGIDERLVCAVAERWLGDASGLNMQLAERAQ